ncbi:uncharacterized protein PFL1_04102 [Pseudozyma flocculosa PF-1]|uniref:Uncharacterized protein n=2 Tax=Pseudozyma flocculosa TaxID=84751 RepID=A0A5C3EV35_9BASI|nr:uncharacterized protein PFL1_04102 [Pseudozyma flocculosa PF-1]EPQ28275.1 hypothetical protein PFL1_04102 [Pseudozyma flocculosa PF-1]SPO35416.1 uncharacterized protein PSFLO_00887 [Pseudozyma flocculosa]
MTAQEDDTTTAEDAPIVEPLSDELNIREPVVPSARSSKPQSQTQPPTDAAAASPNLAPPLTTALPNQAHPLSASAPAPTKPAKSPRVSLSYAERPERPSRRENTSAISAARPSEDGGGLSREPSQHRPRRSQSVQRGRRSIDAAGAAVRRSLSMVRKSDAGPIDPLQEPRRSIGKRDSELHLNQRDPHLANKEWWRQARRAVPFAAPYERSGVVLDQPAALKDWAIPGPLTLGHGQWWYLTFGQSLVAAVISGAINFGVAVALYKGRDTVDLWTFSRQTVAGDMGVTVIIQQIVSFIITSSLTHHDLYAGPIGPLRRPWPPLLHLPSTPDPAGSWLGVRMAEDVKRDGVPCSMGRSEGKSKANGYWWWFVRAVLTGSERNDLLATGISWRQRLERLVWTAAQGFGLCVLTFWWYWPLAIAIVAPIYGGRELAGTWIPMIIKLLFGAILSLLTNPIIALMAMGAESSVRRCYPELPIWYPFGGKADFEQWKAEHGVVDPVPDHDDANGAAGASDRDAGNEADTHTRETTVTGNGTPPTNLRGKKTSIDGEREEQPAFLGSTPIGRRITEEPGSLLTGEDEGAEGTHPGRGRDSVDG